MKDVKNKQLRNKLDKLGIKDVVLNFDSGYVSVWSEGETVIDPKYFEIAKNRIENNGNYVDNFKEDIFDF